MPKLSKVQKKVAKKRGNSSNSLHENSKDAQRLRRAGARSEKLERLATARSKINQPYLQRIAFFQEAAKAADSLHGIEQVHELVQRYLQRHHQELRQLQSERRPGRPSSTREDLLKHSIVTEDREYASGFWMPDMQDENTMRALRDWNGEWTAMNTLKYVRLSKNGTLRQSSFPPKALS